MNKITLFISMIILLILSACSDKAIEPDTAQIVEMIEDYVITPNGDLHIIVDEQNVILVIDALPDSHIIEDEDQRLLILSDPTDRYQHSILGDDIEASSVTIVQLGETPNVIGKFSVPDDWVIESILPIWSDWDGDGEREILLTLSNDTNGAKLVLYDEEGHILAESLPIGKGFRWRHTLDIDAFGDEGQKFLVDIITPHIGGIVNFYSWDKEENLLRSEAALPGYSTHDIGSRDMHMYILLLEEQGGQVLLILPTQSKTELAALRYISGEIHEEWRMPLGGRLSSDLELVDRDGVKKIHAVVDGDREVELELP